MVRDDSWQSHAVCRGADVELFYSVEEADVRAALLLCARCPVRQQCYAQAMAHREAFGVWGGTTEQERRRVFRQSRRSARRQDPSAA